MDLLRIRVAFAAGTVAAFVLAAVPAFAQKQGGTLKISHRDNPPSASIHEEATISTNMPFMAVFNNLVIFDPIRRLNSVDNDRPRAGDPLVVERRQDEAHLQAAQRREVARRQAVHRARTWSAPGTRCTGRARTALRKNPRKVWYGNLKEVTANGDHEVTFHLERPQPSFLAMLATGYTPVYPCHVSARDMRTKPIGTGPFKFVEFKRNESIKLVRNPDYWRKGLPYLDAHRMDASSPTARRACWPSSPAKFDMTLRSDVTFAACWAMSRRQVPKAVCEVRPTNVNTNLIVNRDVAAVQRPGDPHARWRWPSIARRSTRSSPRARPDGASCCRRRTASGACRRRMLAKLPGYGDRPGEEPGRGAQDHGEAGLQRRPSPSRSRWPRATSPSTRSGRAPDRPAQEDLTSTASSIRSTPRSGIPRSRARRTTGRPQPDRWRCRRPGHAVLRELLLRLGAQLHRLLQQGGRRR